MKFDLSNEVLYADILESLRLKNMEVTHDSEGAIELYNSEWNYYMLAAADIEEGKYLIDKMKPDCEITLRGKDLKDYTVNNYDYVYVTECYQVLYQKAEAPKALIREENGERFELSFHHPGEDEFPYMHDTYTFPDGPYFHSEVSNPAFIGGYYNDELVAYIGLHKEGAMGLLYVDPKMRRKGFAEQIYAKLIDNQLKAGAYTYAHIISDNAASLSLQKKFGFTIADDFIYWIGGKK